MDDFIDQLAAQTRFTATPVFILSVQVPRTHANAVLAAMTEACDLNYGDYDHVSFEQTEGIQRFRSKGTGRNARTEDVVEVPCTVLSAQLPHDADTACATLQAIYDAHPYEEPVISLTPSIGTRHIRGLDEDNPNRFWNQKTLDWVPPAHRE
ncbi:MAG: hypothetical protein AAF891_07695 [Pseudomonadota bacterium]